MNVLLNLSPLGDRPRTGIYRVADQLAKGLAARLRERAFFHILDRTGGSTMYFHRNLASHRARLVLSPAHKPLVLLCLHLENFMIDSIENRSLYFRVARKMAAILVNAADKICSMVSSTLFESIDIYHSPFSRIPEWIRQSPVPRFTTIYDLIPITNPEFFEQETVIAMLDIIDSLDEYDYTISISNATRQALLDHSRCSPDRAFVVPLAASDHFFPAGGFEENEERLNSYGISRPGYLLSLGTFEIRKNLEIVVRAYLRLRRENRIPEGTQLVLVGGKGWKAAGFREALDEAGDLLSDILLPGFVPDEDLAAIYSNARAFVYMSHLEGFGLPPLEAMQCGTPTITSNTSSLPEVVGDSGILIAPDDLDSLCDAIESIYADESYHRMMAEKALARSLHFSWEKFLDGVLSAYATALPARR